MSDNFTHNELSKEQYHDSIKKFTLKINSGDRNVLTEPNPFNFKIKFNKYDSKYTTFTKTNWWDYESASVNANLVISEQGAVIEDKFENIKKIRVNQIIAPRYIPSDNIGYYLDDTEAIASGYDNDLIFLRGIDNTIIEYLTDFDDSGTAIEFVRITTKKKMVYLFSTPDYENIFSTTYATREDYNSITDKYDLHKNYVTDKLLLNNNIYMIDSISYNEITLNNNIDFSTSSDIYLPEYYNDTLINTTDDTLFTLSSSSIVFNDLAYLVNYNLVPGSYINYNDDYYFKVTRAQVTYDFGSGTAYITKRFPDLTITDEEYEANGLDKDSLPSVETNVELIGTWCFDTYTQGVTDHKFVLLETGFIDLLDEKSVYVSLDSINNEKNTNSNNNLNKMTGIFYPSTQSTDYVFLSGNLDFNFTYRGLQNMKDMQFQLYLNDGTEVGDNFVYYPVDYRSKSTFQTQIVMTIDQVDRNF